VEGGSVTDLKIAQALAEKFHAGQGYGPYPYTYHLEMVRESVEAASPDERLQVVAVLHDILEDTKCSTAALHALFEDNIVDAVVALTKEPGMTKDEYITRVLANPMATAVKIHDTLANLTESVNRGDKKRVKKYSEQMARLV